jgi:hypothetical protein
VMLVMRMPFEEAAEELYPRHGEGSSRSAAGILGS